MRGGSCRNILVVEDDPEIRAAIQEVLEGDGYTVASVADGRAGLDRLATLAHPCLILLDLMMPGINGFEFLKLLHDDDELATIPVVLVSAWPDEARRVPDAQGFVKKPFELEKLLAFVHAHC